MNTTVPLQMVQVRLRLVGTMLPVSYQGKLAKSRHFSDVIYLDPSTHTKIEEVGSANFFGITADNEFVTPLSPSILPSITKYSLLLAEHRLGFSIEGMSQLITLTVLWRQVPVVLAAVISQLVRLFNIVMISMFSIVKQK